ncbi:MAG: HAMP domain-containing histidine kinase [Ruminococcus sp.]|nr:HAMP domain-containing histidine kinase [Ruminococcus sp.]
MRAFRRICIAVVLFFAALAAGLNISLAMHSKSAAGEYRVEAKRLADSINETGTYDLADYPQLTGVFSAYGSDLYKSEEPYVIIEAGGQLYRVEYSVGDKGWYALPVNIALAVLFLLTVWLLWYFWRHIIRPFGRINKVPQELAKGNLAVPIPEEKSRFFGRFTWGVNLLRESIEDSRKKEVSMQRDKKLLLLSLSHDVKTPLSAIKLNAKALSKGLYTDPDKRREVADSISARADEIEHFITQITQAASEDFMSFDVTEGEEFLSRIITRITERYAVQLAMSGTEFAVDTYSDCLLKCDPDRLAECLQNLIENAMKYGDGIRIGLSFDRMDGCQLITVTNTGCMLEAKELPQIFSSFHRGANADGVPGNGLGLFICRKLMNLMNGEVYADVRDGCFSATLVVRLA